MNNEIRPKPGELYATVILYDGCVPFKQGFGNEIEVKAIADEINLAIHIAKCRLLNLDTSANPDRWLRANQRFRIYRHY